MYRDCLLYTSLLYNGKRGKLKLKYFFYVFYPAHILVPVSYTHLDVYKRQRWRYRMAQNNKAVQTPKANPAGSFSMRMGSTTDVYKRQDAMSVSEMESYRDLILENIEYDYLCREFNTYREDLDEICLLYTSRCV